MRYKRLIISLLLFLPLTFLSGCYAKDFVNDYLDHQEKPNPTIVFTNDKYELVTNEIKTVFYFFNKDGLEGDFEIVLEVNDSEIVSVDGFNITGLSPGSTTMRIRVVGLEIFSEVTVNVRNYDLYVSTVGFEAVAFGDPITIGKNYNFFLLDKNDKSINISDVTFINDNGNLVVSEGKISSKTIGLISYRIIHNETQNVIYFGTLRVKLYEIGIENIVRDKMGKNKDEIITIDELAKVDSIYIEPNKDDYKGTNISTLADLAYFPNEKEAHFSNCQITSSSIKYIQNYEVIDLSGNKLTGAVTINNPNLQSLNLDFNQITSLTITASKLTYFSIKDNQATTIALNDCTTLKRFIAPNNILTSISFLNGNDLEVLDIANNQVTSLDTLSTSTSLTELYVGGNDGLADSNFLSAISSDVRKQLTHLNVGGTDTFTPATSDIVSFVQDCNNLIWLQMYKLNLTSATFINETAFPHLRYLKISHNNISAFSTLSYIEVLVTDVSDNRQN